MFHRGGLGSWSERDVHVAVPIRLGSNRRDLLGDFGAGFPKRWFREIGMPTRFRMSKADNAERAHMF
mgnify:CR=1 FL=1